MKPFSFKKRINIIFFAVVCALIAINPFPLWMFEYRVQDELFQQPSAMHPSIVVVGIDEHSLATFGPFGEWPRSLMADAVNILNTYENERPAVIAIDVLYSHLGRDALADEALVDAVRNAENIVMASRLELGFDTMAMSLNLSPIALETPFDALLPYVEHGLVNGIFERDGFIRNALLHTQFRGEQLYSFPVAIAAMYMGVEPSQLHLFIQENTETYIRYTETPGAFSQFSFADIFEDDFQPWWWTGKIILIGPYSAGMMDHYLVPISHNETMFGVEIHANVTQQILDGAFKQTVPNWARILIVTMFLYVSMNLGKILDIRMLLVLFVTVGIAYAFLARLVFTLGYVLPVLVPLLVLGLVFIYYLVYKYILQTLEKIHLRSVLGKYVAPELVDSLIKSNEIDSNAVGHKKHVAIMFVDVRDFTPIAENLRDTPEVTVEILNECLELASTSIFNNGGSIDKFMGDASMALFNGFVPLDDYIYKAVKAAWEIVQNTPNLNISVKKHLDEDINFGIGIHCGEVIVGNLGPAFRKDYTAIGDAVNIAARLESQAKRSQVLISSEVYDILKDRIECEPVGKMYLRGKSEPIEAFSLTGLK